MSKQRARTLRQGATPQERILWQALRLLKERGLHFRRQAPIDCYIVDFVCHGAKLVVELDGSQHAEPHQAVHDAQRTMFLQTRGYRVLRFWNPDVRNNRDGVLEAILAAASGPPPEIARATRSRFRPPREGEVN